jgi:hypothetical protein
MLKLRILGCCSGGIGGGLRTTSMLLGHDVLIDAGTGIGDLSLDAGDATVCVHLPAAHAEKQSGLRTVDRQ